MSAQLFWIFAVLLVVEILSQLFQFESVGKVFIQFYVLIVHALIGVTLVSFETRDLVYYFVVLIAFVNGLRFVFYKIPSVQESPPLRFFLDLFTITALLALMAYVDQFLVFENVPEYSQITQFAILGSLGLSLLYEMFQRANKTGFNADDFFPGSATSFILVFTSLAVGLGLLLEPLFGLDMDLKFIVLLGYVIFNVIIKVLSNLFARDPEFYNMMYLLPSFVSMLVFIQLIIFGG